MAGSHKEKKYSFQVGGEGGLEDSLQDIFSSTSTTEDLASRCEEYLTVLFEWNEGAFPQLKKRHKSVEQIRRAADAEVANGDDAGKIG